MFTFFELSSCSPAAAASEPTAQSSTITLIDSLSFHCPVCIRHFVERHRPVAQHGLVAFIEEAMA
jgi:hypothetical protein